MEFDNILAEMNQSATFKFSKTATVGKDSSRYQRLLAERFDQDDETSSKDKDMVR